MLPSGLFSVMKLLYHRDICWNSYSILGW
jgi:hypothetical protein